MPKVSKVPKSLLKTIMGIRMLHIDFNILFMNCLGLLVQVKTKDNLCMLWENYRINIMIYACFSFRVRVYHVYFLVIICSMCMHLNVKCIHIPNF